ncbi:MAG TPA: hypothetical protein VIR33_04840, partial [Thermopolyspora sp.]
MSQRADNDVTVEVAGGLPAAAKPATDPVSDPAADEGPGASEATAEFARPVIHQLTEPADPEPASSESADPAPTDPGPASPELAKPEPAKPGPLKRVPAEPEPPARREDSPINDTKPDDRDADGVDGTGRDGGRDTREPDSDDIPAGELHLIDEDFDPDSTAVIPKIVIPAGEPVFRVGNPPPAPRPPQRPLQHQHAAETAETETTVA